MPYKVKGKCVYLKSNNKKVGCTKGSIDDYLSALHANLKESEDDGLDWIRDIKPIIPLRIYMEHNHITDIYNLDGLNVKISEDSQYYQDDSDTNPKDVVGYIDVNEGGFNEYSVLPLVVVWDRRFDITNTYSIDDLDVVPGKQLKESEEEDGLGWIRDVKVNPFISERPLIVLWLDRPINEGEVTLIYDMLTGADVHFKTKLDTLQHVLTSYSTSKEAYIKVYKNRNGVKNLSFGSNYNTFNDMKHQNVSKDLHGKQYLEFYITNVLPSTLKESEDDGLDWIDDISSDLIPGEIYYVKTGNGYYWEPKKIYGKEWDDQYNQYYYLYGDVDSDKSSGRMSSSYVESLKNKGWFKSYDKEWSVKDELTFSEDINDVLNGNFVIYFKDGVYLNQTVELQKKLAELGFSFYTKELGDVVTEDGDKTKLQFIESLNWDKSNEKYNRMPDDQWSMKKLLMVTVKTDNRGWGSFNDPSLREQELFSTAKDHDATVINGDKYIVKNIKESEEDDGLDWIREIQPEYTICQVIDRFRIGDIIIVKEIEDWQDHNITRYNVSGEILDIDDCNEIMPTNWSSKKTILIHFHDDYGGFTSDWSHKFIKPHRNICSDGRCMFLLCDYNGQEEIIITPYYVKKNITEVSIKESTGISTEAREWSDIVYNEILNNPEEKVRLIIDGYEYQNTFEKFPIDYVIIDFHDNVTGYDHTKSGYDKDGNYIVLLYIQPQLVRGIRNYNLKTALNHEFRHAYEDYQRRSKGRPNIDQTKESKLFYTQDFIKLINNSDVTGPIKDILKYYYYTSNIERSAYMENVYDENPEYEKIVREIVGKDFESYKDRFDLDINWHLVNVAYDIPIVKKFKSPREFIDYSAKFLRQKALKILKRINKVKYIHNKNT